MKQNVYSSIGAAVNALPTDNSSQVVFVYPGTYVEQFNVTRGGQTTVCTLRLRSGRLRLTRAPAHGLYPRPVHLSP
jgi:pectin methylesterase-like acyl-CoA thioesterase